MSRVVPYTEDAPSFTRTPSDTPESSFSRRPAAQHHEVQEESTLEPISSFSKGAGGRSRGQDGNLRRIRSFRTVKHMDSLIRSRAMAATASTAPKGTESLDFDLHEREQVRATAEYAAFVLESLAGGLA